VNRVGFDQLGAQRAAMLNAVDTRLKLPTDQVDAVIAAGRDALRINPTFRDFLRGMGGRPMSPPVVPEESTPVAAAPDGPSSSYAAAR
jgi:NTE family protein